MLRAASAVALALLAALAALPREAGAKSFLFSHSFSATSYGSSATSGTPRGLAYRDDELFISDALEDQIFRVNATFPHTQYNAYDTDPFSCALSAVPLACTPTAEFARGVWDIAWDGQSLWVLDKDSSSGSATWLIQLDAGANMLRRINVSASGAAPGGLAYDWRGAGGLVSTDRGSDFVNHFDLSGNLLGISAIGSHSGAATGITHFGDGLFLVSDAGADAILEFELLEGGGAATYMGLSSFVGFDISTLTSIESVEYDPVTFTLFVLDTPSVNSSSVYVFTLVPEPGTGSLLAAGLGGLAARRRRSRAAGFRQARCSG